VSTPDTALARPATRDETRDLFAQTMGLVAITAALFAVAGYLGRNMSYVFLLFLQLFGRR
jgi:hypothetical protein